MCWFFSKSTKAWCGVLEASAGRDADREGESEAVIEDAGSRLSTQMKVEDTIFCLLSNGAY